MKEQWYVLATIVGEFVLKETFGKEKDARAYEAELILQGIWDDIKVWKA